MAKIKVQTHILVPDSNVLYAKDITQVVRDSFSSILKKCRDIANVKVWIPEVVVDEAAAGEQWPTGLLVPFDPDPVTGFPLDSARFARDLAAPIARLMADPALCAKFGAAGRKRVEETFSWQAIAAQTVKLYGGLLTKESAS